MNDIEQCEIEQNNHEDRLMAEVLMLLHLTIYRLSGQEYVEDNIETIRHSY